MTIKACVHLQTTPQITGKAIVTFELHVEAPHRDDHPVLAPVRFSRLHVRLCRACADNVRDTLKLATCEPGLDSSFQKPLGPGEGVRAHLPNVALTIVNTTSTPLAVDGFQSGSPDDSELHITVRAAPREPSK